MIWRPNTICKNWSRSWFANKSYMFWIIKTEIAKKKYHYCFRFLQNVFKWIIFLLKYLNESLKTYLAW